MDKTKSEIPEFEVYFDYLCPFVYRVAVWLREVEKELGEKLPVTWRYFSLEQSNSRNPEKNAWDDDYGFKVRGINAFRAAEAVRRQEEDVFLKFHDRLLDTRHLRWQDISDTELLKNVADEAGADVNRFLKDMDDTTMIEALVRDHTRAVEVHEIFGTPTFVFNGDSPVYLKLEEPDFPDNLGFFREFISIAVDRPNVLEIKRP